MISVKQRALFRPPTLTRLQSAHLVGICGTGMKGLAELLSARGVKVTGSDEQAPSSAMLRTMKKRGLRIHRGHHGPYLTPNVDVLVHSPAIPADNTELKNARQHGIPVMSYTQMLGYLMQSQRGICVAGTHGKSTTTAMIGSILDYSQRKPTVVVGAEVIDQNANCWSGDGGDFVVESCEFAGNFLDLSPTHGVILGVEHDHFDAFESFSDMQATFLEFANKIPVTGSLLVNGTCLTCHEIRKSISAKTESFSRTPGADWWATDLRSSGQGVRFRVFRDGCFFTEIFLAQGGGHNVDNALAAVATCGKLGVDAADIRHALADFSGLRRRYERVGTWRGMTLIDDYAHHPTAIRATLRVARREFGTRKIWCVFQPHQVSRTRALMADFSTSFAEASQVLIAPVFTAREDLPDFVAFETSCDLANGIQATGQSAQSVESLDRIISTLDHEARPGDVLVTMGAGDINSVHHEFTRRLQRNS